MGMLRQQEVPRDRRLLSRQQLVAKIARHLEALSQERGRQAFWALANL